MGRRWGGRAQQPVIPVIGFLNSLSPLTGLLCSAFFRDGLKEMGYVDGQNVAIEYRWAEGHYDRLPELAADLVRRRVAVIAATLGGDPSALAAKATTTTVPIIFNVAEDPVRAGLVASLNRPGGNLTGVSMLTTARWRWSEAPGLAAAREPSLLVAVLWLPHCSIQTLVKV